MEMYISQLNASQKSLLETFLSRLPDMIFLMSVDKDLNFRYAFLNDSGKRASGLDDSVIGKTFDEVWDSDWAFLLNTKYREAVLNNAPVTFVSYGDVIAESILTPILGEEGGCTYVLCVTRDITERMKREDELRFMAFHDTLTELPNRRLFEEKFHQAVSMAKRYEQPFALLFMDCDQFKAINDTLGHVVGDELLSGFAKRLKNCVREADTIARLGGDEFIVLLSNISNFQEVQDIAQRIITSLCKPWMIREHAIQISVSIGISLYPHDGETLDELLHNADQAMYAAKSSGKNRFHFYSELSAHL